MHQQALVRILDGGADLPKKFDSFPQLQKALLRKLGNRASLDIFHREVRNTVLAASIEESGDVGVLEPGQDLPLVPEPVAQQVQVAPPWTDLQCDRLAILVVVADRPIHHSHAAAPDLPDDAIRSDAATRPVDWLRRRTGGAADGLCDTRARSGIVFQQRAKLTPQLGIGSRFLLDECALA